MIPIAVLSIAGVLAALDAPGEWFYDRPTLYLWAPDSQPPNAVRVKTRDFCTTASLGGTREKGGTLGDAKLQSNGTAGWGC